MRPFPLVAALLIGRALTCAATPLAAQTLRAAGPDERCRGERVTAITERRVVRNLITNHGWLGRALTAGIVSFETPTDTAVIRRYVLVHEGERCDEQARAESERILRAQPFISDAVIRAVPSGPDEVRLVVETIDEFQLHLQAWGTTGLPAGLEVGTLNLGGQGASLSGLVEYGYGGHVGGSAKYTDYQAFGQTLNLDLAAAHRPLYAGWNASLSRPFLTNFQRSSWVIGANYNLGYFTFRSPEIRDLSLQFSRRVWEAGRVFRVGTTTSGANFVFAASGDEAAPVRTVVIRSEGPQPAPGPLLLARYPAFSSLRAGLGAGVRKVRFTTVHGFDGITAAQDIAEGVQAFLLVMQGVSPSTPHVGDQVALFNFNVAAGSPHSMTQMGWQSETRIPGGAGDRRPETVGSGRIAWYGQTGDLHTMIVGMEGSGAWRARLPLQLTLRGDDVGLIGWRTSEEGGSQRVVARIEDRWRVPLPIRSADIAVSLLAQAGRLWAGDAAYGQTTPWRSGVGIAFLGAIPAGSKQVIRVEFGHAVGIGASRGMEIRIGWSDNTRYFWREPGDIWLARETSFVSQVF